MPVQSMSRKKAIFRLLDIFFYLGLLFKIFDNTNTTSKTGKVTDFTKLKQGQTIDMMQMASVVSANIE